MLFFSAKFGGMLLQYFRGGYIIDLNYKQMKKYAEMACLMHKNVWDL